MIKYFFKHEYVLNFFQNQTQHIATFTKSLRNQKRKQDKKMTKFEKNSRPQRKSPENENIVTAIMITNPKNIERKTKKVEK